MKRLVIIALTIISFLISNLSELLAQQRPTGMPSNMPAGMDRNIGTLRGKLIDGPLGKPIEYGNIVLFQQQDSTMVTGTISKPDGSFVIEKISVGRYYAVVQFIGYESITIPGIFINFREPEVNLGDVRISSRNSNLEGVEVKAERDVMIANLDKRVINVEKDLTSVGGTAVDIMQNIPSVTVDVEGNVKLRGSSNVLILIDGKPTGMEGISSSDILQQIPANSIETVEVITNPSVRYDPDGTTGIINIVLKKRNLEGMNGMVSLNAGTGNRYNGNLSLGQRSEKFNITASIDGRLNKHKSSSEMERTTTFEDITTSLDQQGSNNNNMNMIHGSLGFDYIPNRFNTYTFQLRYRNFRFESEGETTNKTFNNDNIQIRDFKQLSESERKMNSFNYTLTYRRTTKRKGEELIADLIFMDNSMNMGDSTNQHTTFPQNSRLVQETNSSNTNKMGIAQLNYVRPINENSRFEVGFKSEIKGLDMKYTYNWSIPYSSEPSFNKTENDFNYIEQIHAVYGIYAGQKNKFRYQTGLRVEQAFVWGEEKTSASDFNKKYFSLYPSVHLVYALSANKDLQISYSRRVSRPNNRNLNSYIDYSDSLNIRSGNPELRPEYTGSWDLSFVTFKGRNSFTSSVFYRRTTDVMQQVTELAGNGVTWTRPQNLTSSQSYGLELILAREATKWLRVNANASYFRYIINRVPEFSIEGTDDYTWNTRLSTQISTTKTTTLQISGNYSAPTIMAQGKMEAMYFADIAWRAELLDRKLSLSVRLSDIFNSRRFESESWGPGFNTKSLRKRDSRVFYVGVSYRINNYQQRRDRLRTLEDNSMEPSEF